MPWPAYAGQLDHWPGHVDRVDLLEVLSKQARMPARAAAKVERGDDVRCGVIGKDALGVVCVRQVGMLLWGVPDEPDSGQDSRPDSGSQIILLA
jgi:hypothetical protein